MQTYMVYKFDNSAAILKDSRQYRVVAKGSDKVMFWSTRIDMWCESVFRPDDLARLSTFVGERKMQLK